VEANRVKVADAVDAFMKNAARRNLARATLSKIKTIFQKQLLNWCTTAGIVYLDQLDITLPDRLAQRLEGWRTCQ
jgi:hypothetical protein